MPGMAGMPAAAVPPPAAGSAGQGAPASGGSSAAYGPYGPEIGFHHTFPRPGLYKVWGQFQTGDGRVVTADFVVRAP